jgi:branched-chain amino acid transport system ATP-binding protein
MTGLLIELQTVDAYYGSSHILHGLDLRLERGSCLGLMGRNGMGKTTTLKTIVGHVRPQRGNTYIMGRDASELSPHEIAKAGIAYVPEERAIFPNLTVTENLVMAARPGIDGARTWTEERVMALFPRLAQRRDHWGNHLSGGEQQMLSIGRALMTNPDVLLLDEATEGLAPLIREEIWSVISEIKSTGMSAIIVDKDAARLQDLCDQHMILVKGRAVFSGDRAALQNEPDILHRHLGI